MKYCALKTYYLVEEPRPKKIGTYETYRNKKKPMEMVSKEFFVVGLV